MGIEDIQISEELETNAPSIKYSGDEGPKSPQQMQEMMMAQLEEEYLKYVDDMMEQGMEPITLEQFLDQTMAEGQMAGGPPLPNDPTEPVNPFGPKPMGPPLPDRQMAAYGGIMGLDGRKQYGIGSWFQKNIMDPIKKNPLIAAAALTGGVDLYRNQGESVVGKIFNNPAVQRVLKGKEIIGEDKKGTGKYEGGVYDALAKNIVPIVGGLGAGLFTKKTEGENTNPGVPDDQTGMNIQEYTKGLNLLDEKGMMAAGQNFALADDARKYTPTQMIDIYQNAQNAQNAANGGRIGYMGGGMTMGDPRMMMPQSRMPMEEGGIMDLGGMEKDYRAEGGFVPIGGKEKADDVPARLSVNEFVFTADAVRNAGGGDIDKGAQVMENMMKHLEQGGQVSEESQGMSGAQEMFETSERLSEVV